MKPDRSSRLHRSPTCQVFSTQLFTADPVLGAILKLKDASDLQQLLPQLQHKNISNAGHSIHRDQIFDYLAALNAFLKEI